MMPLAKQKTIDASACGCTRHHWLRYCDRGASVERRERFQSAAGRNAAETVEI